MHGSRVIRSLTPSFCRRPYMVLCLALLGLAVTWPGRAARAQGPAPAGAGAGGPQDPEAGVPSLEEWRARTGIEWQSRSTRRSNGRLVVADLLRPYPTPSAQGQKAAPPPAGPIGAVAARQRAVDFVQANSPMLLGAAVPLAAEDVAVNEIITNRYPPEYQERGEDYTVVMEQMHGQVRVFEAQTRVAMTQSGDIWQVSNGFSALGGVPDAPKLDKAAALAQVRAVLNDPAAQPEEEPELFVYPPSQLAWRVNVLEPHFQEILVDAVSGQVLLQRRNVHDACTVALTVTDKDGLALPAATGQYYANSVQGWSKTLDANGQASDSSSATGTSYCRASIVGARINVKDTDSGGTTVVQDTPTFTTVTGSTYNQTITLNNSSGVNSSEGGVAFRETMRAWNYVNTNYGYARALATVNVDASSGPSCGGSTLYFPHGRAIMDNGPPSTSARCDDTMLHEYGHAMQYGAYGGWGRPSGCSCDNHGGTANDCSFDALIEGWAEYFPVMVYHHINIADTHYDWSNSTSSKNIETNANTDTEERDEWSFAGALFDIYDSANDSGDTLALGDDEIWTVMRNDKPGTVEQFFQKFIARYPAYAAGLEQIYTAHAMHPAWLTLSATQLPFGETQNQMTFTIQRTGWYGDGVVVQPTWSISKDASWITVISPSSGSTTTETDTITVTIDRAGLSAGLHTGTITVAPQYYGRAKQITVTCQSGAAPNTPSPVSPADGASPVSLTPLLQASAFSDPNSGDTHAASQWRVDDNSDFSSPEYDSLETAVDKTQVRVPAGRLAYSTTYYWHVRYKDSGGLWSAWSSPWSFRCTCNGVGADLDGDCDVDNIDLLAFESCLSGAETPYLDPRCGNVDADEDGDVDQSDYGVFQRCLSGTYQPADPNCAS